MIDLNTSPDKLRKSILQEAMQGKLTQQLPEDGNAADLLQSIAEEKQRLYKTDKIKKPKRLATITDDEIPFKIPDNWKWVKLGNIINLRIGKTPPRHNPKYWNGNIPWVSVKDMNNGILNSTNEGITKEAADEKFKNKIVPKGTMLMSFKLSIGKVCILGQPAYHNEAIISLNFYKYEENMKQYLFRIIKFLTKFAKSKNAIEGQTLNKTSLNNMLIPLPPLMEQKRIVSKLDSLLPKLDSFKQSVNHIQTLRSKLPPRLRRSFLQEAMQGKLTQQLPGDGDAADLLPSISEEKQRLYKAGKIKKPKQLASITDDEVPFKIPDNWQWVRMNDLFIEGPQKRPDKKSLYIDVKGIKNNKITNLRLINQNNAPSRARKLVYKGDLIYSTVRPYLHNVAIINKNHNHELFASTAFVVMKSFVNNKYLKYITLSSLFDKQVNELATGTTYPAINNTNFKKIIIPLPPLVEQERIVNKLDSLLFKINRI